MGFGKGKNGFGKSMKDYGKTGKGKGKGKGGGKCLDVTCRYCFRYGHKETECWDKASGKGKGKGTGGQERRSCGRVRCRIVK